jgi:hypothetical protein
MRPFGGIRVASSRYCSAIAGASPRSRARLKALDDAAIPLAAAVESAGV